MRPPGHVVRLTSRWPDTRGSVTLVPAAYLLFPAEMYVVVVPGFHPFSEAFQPTSLAIAVSSTGVGATAPELPGSWFPSEATPKVWALNPAACAPTTLRATPPYRPSKRRPKRSTRKL